MARGEAELPLAVLGTNAEQFQDVGEVLQALITGHARDGEAGKDLPLVRLPSKTLPPMTTTPKDTYVHTGT